MDSHEIDYQIVGNDMQAVIITLDQFETVIAEAGAMSWMDQGINFEAKMGDGSTPRQSTMDKLFSAGKRLLTGESLFLTRFTNNAPIRQEVTFAAPYPGQIIPLDLKEVGGEITCQKDAFLCAAKELMLASFYQKNIYRFLWT